MSSDKAYDAIYHEAVDLCKNGEFVLSYSSFHSHSVCNHRFILEQRTRLLKVKPKRVSDSRNFLVGWCAHKIAEKWNKEGHWAKEWLESQAKDLPKKLTDEFLAKNFVRWRTEDDRQKLEEKIQICVDSIAYWVPIIGLNNSSVHSEKWFDVRLDKLNIRLKGSVDLVDFTKFDLYDIKSSKKPDADWDQLLFYDLAMTIKYNRKVHKTFMFYPIQDYPTEEKEFTLDDIKEMKERIGEFVCTARKGVFEPTNTDPNVCYMCSSSGGCKYSRYKYTKNEDKLKEGKASYG